MAIVAAALAADAAARRSALVHSQPTPHLPMLPRAAVAEGNSTAPAAKTPGHRNLKKMEL
jgi:hypothetical protein